MTAAMARSDLAAYVLAGAFVFFGLMVIAALIWAERDRRRALNDRQPGLRLIRPFQSSRERW